MRLHVVVLASMVASLLAPVPVTAQEGTGAIAGSITLDSPVPFKVMVTVYDSFGVEIASGPTFTESGNFTIEGLSPGTYKLRLGDKWYDSKETLEGADLVTVEAGLSTRVAARMTVADLGRIEGRVYDSVSGEGIPCVNIIGARPYVGDDGSYALYLSPGQWKVDFVDVCRFVYEEQWWDGKESRAEADPLTVVAGQTLLGIDAPMRLPTDSGGWISGTVYDAETGETVPGICVTPFDENGEVPQVATNVSWPRTDLDGVYRIGYLGEGEYRVRFSDCGFFAWETRWWRDAMDLETADWVQVALGEEVAGIDVELPLQPDAVRPTPPLATTPTTAGATPGELPFTGSGSIALIVLAGLGMLVGALTLRWARE